MKLACYQLTSMYMKGIQAGIQGGHATDELAAKFIEGDFNVSETEFYKQWVVTDKTVKIKNAGGSMQILNLMNALIAQDVYPYSAFCEPELNSAVTALAVVLPCDITQDMLNYEPRENVRELLYLVDKLRSAN